MYRPIVVAAFGFVLVGCHTRVDEAADSAAAAALNEVGRAEMRSSTGVSLGTLRLVRGPQRVLIFGTLNYLPAGTHGIHIHTVGKCEAPSFESAGSHFNPTGAKHGLENPNGPHAGDFPNLVADQSNKSIVNLSSTMVTLDNAPRTGLFDADGSAIVIHAGEDDQKSDPSGNSGARIACGLITQ